jgi:hypothetical protein
MLVAPGLVTGRLLEFLKLGFTVLSLNLIPDRARQNEQTERLAREVVPALPTATPGL